MDNPDPEQATPPDARRLLVETVERRCPSCRGQQVAPIGQVTAMLGVIKSTYECAVCRHRFVFIRTSPFDR